MEIFNKHKEWLRMAYYLGGDEDDVQEMYIKLLEKEEVNNSYVYLTLRSIIFRRKSTEPRQEAADQKYHDAIYQDKEYNKAEDIVYNNIEKVLDSLHWYDAKLFRLYRKGTSIRKLGKATGISWMSIFTTLKNVKQRIREEAQEDYIDLNNNDYEYIKEWGS
jgi:hypothetical protein